MTPKISHELLMSLFCLTMLGVKPGDDTLDDTESQDPEAVDSTQQMATTTKVKSEESTQVIPLHETRKADSDNGEESKSSEDVAPLSFTFTVEEAVQIMCSMDQQSSYGNLIFHSTTRMNPTAAVAALDAFISMRLIHNPRERVHIAASYAEALQPTAKGLAVLQSFCQKYGCFSGGALQMFMSEYNTMKLIKLPRGPRGTLQLSTALIMVIWRRMLGKEPNMFNPEQKPQPVVVPTYAECVGAGREFIEGPSQRKTRGNAPISPYFHRFFIHPSSNSTSQYWDSTGVRIFQNTTFERAEGRVSVTEYRLKQCLAGKAMWQWIMECTDTRSFQEAASIVKLFIDNGLAIAITDKVSEMVTCDDNMPAYLSRGSFYCISARGLALSAWKNAAKLFDNSVDELLQQKSSDSWGSKSEDSSKSSKLDKARKKTYPFESDDETNRSSTGSIRSAPKEVNNKPVATVGELDWLFEDKRFSRKNVNREFESILGLSIILQEPGLRFLFAEKLEQWQCVEPLLFLEDYSVLRHHCLKMVKAEESKDKMASVHYTNTAWELLGRLIYRYTCVGAPNELNLNDSEREHLIKPFEAVATMDGRPSIKDKRELLDLLAGELSPIVAQQRAHLEENVGRFAKSDVTSIEDLRQHIVCRLVYTTSTCKEDRVKV